MLVLDIKKRIDNLGRNNWLITRLRSICISTAPVRSKMILFAVLKKPGIRCIFYNIKTQIQHHFR